MVRYREVTSKHPCGSFDKWQRIPESEIPAYLQSHPVNAFATAQAFHTPRLQTEDRQQDEPHDCDLFIDLDSEDPSLALEDAKKILAWARAIDLDSVRVWFSGSKGFHLAVPQAALGMETSPALTRQVKAFVEFLQAALGLQTVDMGVYTTPRMWRIPGSIHSKTGQKCKEVDPRDLINMEHVISASESEEPPPASLHDHAHQLWLDRLSIFEDRERLALLSASIIQSPPPSGMRPECVLDLLNRGIRKPGDRNRAELVLATFLKLEGKTEAEAIAEITAFTVRIQPGLTSTTDQRSLEISARSVVRSVWTNPSYRFACRFIRSLGTPESRITCNHRSCPLHQADPVEAKDLPLHDICNSVWSGLRIRSRALVSGMDDSPYIIPTKVIVSCNPNDTGRANKCTVCAFQANFGCSRSVEFTPQDPAMLSLLDCSTQLQRGAIKAASGLPKDCDRHHHEVVEHGNVQEVSIVPSVSAGQQGESRFVSLHAFSMGADLRPGTEYEMEGWVHPHPRTQKAVFSISKATPVRNTAESLDMTPSLHDELMRAWGSTSVADSISKWEEDLEKAVTHIWGRREVATAIDLTMHSALGFRFNGEEVKKGWLTTLVIGDSGQAKTELTERMVAYYGVGRVLSGESSSRTGLAYSIQQHEGRWFVNWGALVLNDRGFLAIDEFGGLDQEEVEQLSRVLSSGIAECDRVRQAKALARTRLLLLANPRGRERRQLRDFVHGCEAINTIYKQIEDIRRLDFAVTVASGDVAPEVINAACKTSEPKYDRRLSRARLLFAWSRKPEDIVFTQEATDFILQASVLLASKYSSGIPLVEPADQRYKLARMAVATAALAYRSPDGRRLIVDRECAEYATAYLQDRYNAESCGYDAYSVASMAKRDLTPAQRAEVLRFLSALPEVEVLIDLLMGYGIFRKKMLLEQWGEEYEGDGCRLWKMLSRHNLITSKSEGFVKSPAFISILKELKDANTKEQHGPRERLSKKGLTIFEEAGRLVAETERQCFRDQRPSGHPGVLQGEVRGHRTEEAGGDTEAGSGGDIEIDFSGGWDRGGRF